jgi:hypothetical protein
MTTSPTSRSPWPITTNAKRSKRGEPSGACARGIWNDRTVSPPSFSPACNWNEPGSSWRAMTTCSPRRRGVPSTANRMQRAPSPAAPAPSVMIFSNVASHASRFVLLGRRPDQDALWRCGPGLRAPCAPRRGCSLAATACTCTIVPTLARHPATARGLRAPSACASTNRPSL